MTSCRKCFDYGGVQEVLMLVGNFFYSHTKKFACTKIPPAKPLKFRPPINIVFKMPTPERPTVCVHTPGKRDFRPGGRFSPPRRHAFRPRPPICRAQGCLQAYAIFRPLEERKKSFILQGGCCDGLSSTHEMMCRVVDILHLRSDSS